MSKAGNSLQSLSRDDPPPDGDEPADRLAEEKRRERERAEAWVRSFREASEAQRRHRREQRRPDGYVGDDERKRWLRQQRRRRRRERETSERRERERAKARKLWESAPLVAVRARALRLVLPQPQDPPPPPDPWEAGHDDYIEFLIDQLSD